jgi:hypothetical protein
MVAPTPGHMFRIDHEDRVLCFHIPENFGPKLSLYERRAGKDISSFKAVPTVLVKSLAAKLKQMKVDAKGVLWLGKTAHSVEWIGAFSEAKDVKVTYVEGVSDVKGTYVERRGGGAYVKSATEGGEVRLSNGTAFKNLVNFTTERATPWMHGLSEKAKPLQCDLMLKDPRDSFQDQKYDQVVGWAAPLSDVERYEKQFKRTECATCTKEVFCCPCRLLWACI